jgi:hypothetical protein
VAAVLHLHAREVALGGAEQVHAAPRVESEVGRVRGAEQAEAQPVRIEHALALVRREESLRRGVGADHERDVTQAGEDACARGLDRLRARRARGVRARDRDARVAERLREARCGDEARVAVADRLARGEELHVANVEARVGERRLGGVDAVLDEVAPPLAPGMHADAEDCDFVIGHACS